MISIHSPTWINPPADWVLSVGEVHVWRVSLAVEPIALSSLFQILSPDERQRAERFRFDRDRHRFIIGRGSLRAILGRYLHVAPAQLQFCYGANGKPELGNAFSASNLEFNVSHSQDWMLCAIAQGAIVGVDLECVRPISDLEQLTQRFFAPQECRAIQALPIDQQLEAFFQYWTCKEALLKATGKGLADLSSVELAIADGSAKLVRWGSESSQPTEWQIELISPAPDYVGAIAIARSELNQSADQFSFWQWQNADDD